MSKSLVAACSLLLFTVSACGRSPMSPAVVFSGNWQGTFESPADGPGTITLDLTQTGLNVSGSVQLSQGTLTDVPGTMIGTVTTASSLTLLQFTVTYEYGPFACQGSFSGTLNATSTDIQGSFSGQNCVQAFSGTLHVTKHN